MRKAYVGVLVVVCSLSWPLAQASAQLEQFIRVVTSPPTPSDCSQGPRIFIVNSSTSINGVNGPHVIVCGANLHVQSGSGATTDNGTLRGLGNLVVGYNEFPNETLSAGRGGSHNLIVGSEHQYGNYGGLVAGFNNVISAPSASVTGGSENTAEGPKASISGGNRNHASGVHSSISGGVLNEAQYDYASISGGARNQATGAIASVSGGTNNIASGASTSVSGGNDNSATVDSASVSGGEFNMASGYAASISGGSNNTASSENDFRPVIRPPCPRGSVCIPERSIDISRLDPTLRAASVSGDFNNTAHGDAVSVSGGSGNVTRGANSSISGGTNNAVEGQFASISGESNTAAAEGRAASISGGQNNFAESAWTSVSGGDNNHAPIDSASVSGGEFNMASGYAASISGGSNNTASSVHDFRPIGPPCPRGVAVCTPTVSSSSAPDPTLRAASVSGGQGNTAEGAGASVIGGAGNLARGTNAVSGIPAGPAGPLGSPDPAGATGGITCYNKDFQTGIPFSRSCLAGSRYVSEAIAHTLNGATCSTPTQTCTASGHTAQPEVINDTTTYGICWVCAP